MSTFGKRLRQAREKKGLTQVQLANMLGVKGNSISDWENDKNRPHMDTIELIMGVLEVDANTLYDEKLLKKL
jgi:transcriptional regulator with XRE-family HTH domain